MGKSLKSQFMPLALFVAGTTGFFSIVAFTAPVLTDEQGTRTFLKENNLTPVEVGGGVWFAGSYDELWRTKFEAKNKQGETVKGYAGRGLLGAQVLKFD